MTAAVVPAIPFRAQARVRPLSSRWRACGAAGGEIPAAPSYPESRDDVSAAVAESLAAAKADYDAACAALTESTRNFDAAIEQASNKIGARKAQAILKSLWA